MVSLPAGENILPALLVSCTISKLQDTNYTQGHKVFYSGTFFASYSEQEHGVEFEAALLFGKGMVSKKVPVLPDGFPV